MRAEWEPVSCLRGKRYRLAFNRSLQMQKGCRHVRSRCQARRRPGYRRAPPGVEGGQSRAAVGEQVRASAGAAARGRLSVVVGEDPAADRRRDQGRLAGGGRAARAAARPAGARRAGGRADVEDARGQHPGAAAGRARASAPPHHECVALRAGRLGRDHDRGRQAVPDGGGRSDPHAGLDLA